MPDRERLVEIVVNVTRMFSRLAATGIIVGTMASFFAAHGHWFDLFTHFSHVYLLGGLIFASLLFATGARRHALVLTMVALVNVVPVAGWLPSIPSRSGQATCEGGDKVVVINAYVGNERHDIVEQYAVREQPAVLVVSELVPALHDRLAQHFAHSAYERLRNGSGVGVYSAYPLTDVRGFGSPRYGLPQLEALLQTPGGPVRLIAAHPLAPFNPSATDDRNRTLAQFVEITRRSDEPVLLAGDLNISMWSPQYTPLTDAGLRNAREGRGVMATFPTKSPVRIPIDHVMFTDEIAACDFSVGEDVNSDHLPIVAKIAWPTATERSDTTLASIER